jgi:16S rRNA (guanine966-N2)-methyltransferase
VNSRRTSGALLRITKLRPTGQVGHASRILTAGPRLFIDRRSSRRASVNSMAKPKRRRADPLAEPAELRIIGGRFRGRKLRHEPFLTGDSLLVTRPMKHRLRESIFNLVSTEAEGRHAIDLFAGTGALGLEALSRGAVHATLIEKHVPTARVIDENIQSLGVQSESTLLVTSAFVWAVRDIPKAESRKPKAEEGSAFRFPLSDFPWLVFCSPPYDFFVERQVEMLQLIAAVVAGAPAASVLIVESDERFDPAIMTAIGANAGTWDVRPYPPAVVGIWRKAPK